MAKAIDPKFGELLKELECGICYENVTDAQLCPRCCQIFCGKCIFKWMDTSRDCPKCRALVERCALVKGRVIDSIMESLTKLIAYQDPTGKDHCSKHSKQQLSMYCFSCMDSICAKCFFSKEHTNHKGDVVLLDEAFKTYQDKLKIAMDGVNQRKEHIKRVLKAPKDEEDRLKNEMELLDGLEKESKALVAAEANPEKMKAIVETERLITELPEYTSKCVAFCGIPARKKKKLVPPPQSLVPPPQSLVPPPLPLFPPPLSLVPPPLSLVPPPLSLVPRPPFSHMPIKYYTLFPYPLPPLPGQED